MTDDELMHYGILGMKWGVRRYQNPDGSLTAAGKKRYGNEVSKMSNEELRAKTERTNLENAYLASQRNHASLTSENKKSGKGEVKKFLSSTVMPVVSKTVQSYAENFLKEKLGLTTETEKLKKENEKLQVKKKNQELKNYFSTGNSSGKNNSKSDKGVTLDDVIKIVQEQMKSATEATKSKETVDMGRNFTYEYFDGYNVPIFDTKKK